MRRLGLVFLNVILADKCQLLGLERLKRCHLDGLFEHMLKSLIYGVNLDLLLKLIPLDWVRASPENDGTVGHIVNYPALLLQQPLDFLFR